MISMIQIYPNNHNKLMNKVQNTSAEKWLEKDRAVWVKALPTYPNQYQDAFLQGKVAQISGNQVIVDLVDSMSRVKSPIQNCLKLTYGPLDVADMVDLEQLNQPELLFNIKRRYVNDLIFTYCGPTLVIINPYVYIEKLFNQSVLQQYQSMVFTDNLEYKSLPPHVFALTAFCLWQLFDNERSQSIVISGESGAGKTQNTKYCLKFLASLGRNMKELTSQASTQGRSSLDSGSKSRRINYQNMRSVQKALQKASSKVFGMQDKILGCNEILEAFGNSKTIRNDNSSRFGKLILLVYGQTHIDIKSALIISYLLQKSRIVSVADGERNYHVFYYFCKGTTPEEKQKYLLKDPINKYYYLNQSTTYDLPKVSDEDKFLEIKREFGMYLTPEETDCVYRIISIVLNAGNILFEKSQNKNNQEMVIIKNDGYIKNITELLEVDFDKFKNCFENKTRKMGVNIISSPLKYSEAISLRDSFSKNIYEQIFNFLVSKLNEKIQIQKIDFQDTSSRANRKSIGLLDIFGFEVLQINSLEQFFINFANEKLQQLYVSYIFKEEQNQFLKEGLKQFSHEVGFQDNKPIIDLFEEFPLGIFHLINQSSQLNKPDENLPDSIIKNHKKNNVIEIPKSKRSMFKVNHSCSPVEYNTNGFTAKNKDSFPNQMLEVILQTKNPVMKTIIVGKQGHDKPKGKASSKFLGSKFLNEMNKLTEELYSCDCHFVRCIKPNSKKAPKLFNSEAVLQSLRYLGVLDSIIIRKLGYIYRRPYKQFFKKFFELQAYIFNYPQAIAGKNEDDLKEQCRKIVQKFAKKQLDQNDVLFGSKKILVKQSALNHLQSLTKQKRKERIQTANRIKIMYKNSVFRMQVKSFNFRIALLKFYLHNYVKDVRQEILNKKVLKVQSVIRKYLWHLRLQKIKEQATKSVTKISAYYKMKKQRKKFLEIRAKTIRLQATIRTFISMGRFFKEKSCRTVLMAIYNQSWMIIQDKKALIIQKNWRGYKIRKTFQEALRMTKCRAFMKRAIIKFRYRAFKQLLMAYKKPIIKMQSIVRGRYLRKTFLKVRQSAVIIQKAYRRHLHKRFYLNQLWKNYKLKLNHNEDNKMRELMRLGVIFSGEKIKKKNLIETNSNIYKLYPRELIAQYVNAAIKQQKDIRINENLYLSDKNSMQAYIQDLDMISIGEYNGMWTEKFAELKQQMSSKGQYPLSVHFGQNFTCIITNRQKMYTFSANQEQEDDHSFSKIDLKTTPLIVSINQHSGHLLSKDNTMYEWGQNFNGELFIKSKNNLVNYTEAKSAGFVYEIEAKGNNRYYVDKQGKVITKIQNRLTPISLGNKVQIIRIISSYQFTHFLTANGQLYSKGSNRNSELAIDSKKIRFVSEPVLNEYFVNKKEMIQTVSVGMGHTIAKSKLGYVYVWGDNRFGQIHSQPTNQVGTPIQVELDKHKIKALQAVAGLRSSYILLDSFQIMGIGTSSSFNSVKNSGYINLDLIMNTNMIPIKLSCSWNRVMSGLFVNCIEKNKCKPGSKPDIILKYCKIIAKQWHEKIVYPPYHQWMDNTLNLSDMRKFKFTNLNKPKPVSSKNVMDSDLSELKLLMDLRKTSSLFKMEARKKIEKIVHQLSSKSNNQWSRQDHQVNNYIKQHCQGALK